MNATTHNHLRVLVLALILLLLWCLLMKRGLSGEEEESRRARFQQEYWDIETEQRMEALEFLKNPQEDKSLYLLYAVSYWDPELRIRLRAFQMLVDARDDFGYVALLAGRSFRLDYCGEAKARKAELMRGLEYKWETLNALCEEVIRLRYPGYGTDYRSWQCPFHGCAHAPCKINPVCGGWWWGWTGGFRGIGALGPGVDYETWIASRRRLTKILDAINYLGCADFKLAYKVESSVKKWWQLKSPEFLEVDRRERERVRRAMKAAELAARDEARKAAESAAERALKGQESPETSEETQELLAGWLRNEVAKLAQKKRTSERPPSPLLSPEMRERMAKAALAAEEED